MELERLDGAAFEPENELEIALAEARAGHIAIDACLEKLLSNDLFILSKSEVLQDGSGIAPLLFDFEGTTFVAVFSSLARAKLHTDKAQYCLKIIGSNFFKRIPEGYGAVINPGFSVQLEIMPEGLGRLVS